MFFWNSLSCYLILCCLFCLFLQLINVISFSSFKLKKKQAESTQSFLLTFSHSLLTSCVSVVHGSHLGSQYWYIKVQSLYQVHSVCPTFCGFWQMCNNTYPPLITLSYRIALLPHRSPFSTYWSLPPSFWTPDLLFYRPFSRIHRVGIIKGVAFSVCIFISSSVSSFLFSTD